LAKLILLLGVKEISSQDLKELTCNAEEEAIKLHPATMPTQQGHLVLRLLPPTPMVLIKIVIPRIKPLSLGVIQIPSNTETCFQPWTLVLNTESHFCVRHKGRG
jgi:hypothetical protein